MKKISKRRRRYQETIASNDIKYDLLKIIEPWDGYLEKANPQPVHALFISYLKDLKKRNTIFSFVVETIDNDMSFTYHIAVQRSPMRAPKKFKIHVGKFHVWQ